MVTENVLVTSGSSGDNFTREVKAVNAVEVGGSKSSGYVPTVQADNETVEWSAGGGSGSLPWLANNISKVSADVSPAVKEINYLVDASGGIITISLPDVVAGNTDWFAITLAVDSNHVHVTTVGGIQLINGATTVGVFAENTTIVLKANGVDGYDFVMDTRVYYRTVEVTADLDLGDGYESGTVYRAISATGAQVTITIPDTSAIHKGLYAKFIVGTDNGTSIKLVTTSGEDIGTSAEQLILEPYKGLEVCDMGDGYLVTQDSRPDAGSVAVNFFPTANASTLEPTYFALDTVQPATSTVTTDPITSSDSANPQSLGFWIDDGKALVGDLELTPINAYGTLKLTSAFSRSIRIKFKYYEYDYDTDTLNPTALSETSYSGVIDNTAFEEFFIGGSLPANTWAETSTVGKVLVAELLAYKSAAGGDNPTLDFQTGTSLTRVTVPVASVNHATLGGVVDAGTGVPDGHVNNSNPLQLPELTTTERDAVSSPNAGMVIWNTTTGRIEEYNGSSWAPVAVQGNILYNTKASDVINPVGVSDGDTVASGDYTVAGWGVVHDCTQVDIDLTSGSFGIVLTDVTAGTAAKFVQAVESFADYQGKTLTLSAEIVANNAATLIIEDGAGTGTSSAHSGGGAAETLSVTRTIDGSATKLQAGFDLVIGANNYARIQWIQLKVEPIASDYEDSNIALDDIKSKRFLQVLGTGLHGEFKSTSEFRTHSILPVTMRAVPSMSLLTTTPDVGFDASFLVGSGSTLTGAVTATGIQYADINGFTGATADQFAYSRTDKLLKLSAELTLS